MRLLHDPAFLTSIVGRIYDCVLEPALWRPLLADLAGMMGARRAVMALTRPRRGDGDMAVMVGLPDADTILRVTPINPLLPIGMTYPPDVAFVASRDYGLPALKASRFYREYLEPLGDLDCISFLVTREADAFGHWAIMTQDDRGPITAEEIAALELLAPHVRRAAEISQVLGRTGAEAATFRAALDELDCPVMILDDRRRLAFANPRAEEALASGAVLRLRDGAVRGATEEAERLLRRLATDAAPGGAAGFEAVVAGADGEQRLVFAVALDAEGDRLLGAAARSVLVVLRAPRADTRNPIAVAARVFALSPAQVQVLAFLAQGHAPDAIADILGISVATVRTHLSDLFRKTETTRQPELVARALSFASPLRSPPDAGD